MIQAPQNYGMSQPCVQQQKRQPAFAPSYNAVQINLDTPTLNAPPAMPYYMPPNMTMPPQQPQAPEAVPPQQPQTPAQVPPPVLNGPAQPEQSAPAQAPAQAPAPQVDVKQPDEKGPEALAEEAFKGLSSADYDTQALAMEEIAKKGLNNQEDVVPYVQENIFDKLIDIMNVDTSNLPGPTDEQVAIRNKMSENEAAKEEAVKAGKNPDTVQLPHTLSAQQVELGNKLSPFEQAERNKEYAMFTTCILQKTYADEVQKLTGNVPPVTELPGAAAVITTLKENPNPDMRVSAIDALRYVEKPEYKDDLTTLFTIAQTDADPNVSEAASQALASLNAPKEEAQPAA